MGTRVLSNLEKLYLTIKKLSLIIEDGSDYFKIAHEAGIPIKNLKKLQNNLFGLEANFEELSAIDFKKGCYIGQENTARMKLKNKLKKKLLPIVSKENFTSSGEILVPSENFASFLILKATQDLSDGTLTPSAIKPYWLNGSSNEDFIKVSKRYADW